MLIKLLLPHSGQAAREGLAGELTLFSAGAGVTEPSCAGCDDSRGGDPLLPEASAFDHGVRLPRQVTSELPGLKALA